jgi:predicted transport protein
MTTMKDLIKSIEELQAKYKRHQRSSLKEYPTRAIFIDTLLRALGWDVRDPDEVELEYPTIDGKSVDYALKVNKQPVALLEAKALDDPLDDVKAITQVVGYATNDGIEWCILTNGVRFKVYSSSQKATAPNKLLFEVTIDPETPDSLSIEQMATQLSRFSCDAMARGVLNQLGEEVFTTAKVRKALDHLFAVQDETFVRMVRRTMADDTITPAQVRAALSRIWRGQAASVSATKPSPLKTRLSKSVPGVPVAQRDYGESRHTMGKPETVVEMYRSLDRQCHDLAPGKVSRRYMAQHVGWSVGKATFCSAHLLHSGLKVWLRIRPEKIPSSATYARDVSRVGHWGVGDVEMIIDSQERLADAATLIRASFEAVTKSGSQVDI